MLEGFRAFFAKPYDDEMSATDWFLFIGLLLCILTLWRLIMAHILAELD